MAVLERMLIFSGIQYRKIYFLLAELELFTYCNWITFFPENIEGVAKRA